MDIFGLVSYFIYVKVHEAMNIMVISHTVVEVAPQNFNESV